MESDARLSTRRKVLWACKVAGAGWREGKGQFDRAMKLLDEAAAIHPLRPSGRVRRAMLMLRSQRSRDAHQAFPALRDEFKGSENPDLQYLRRYCTAMLSMLTQSSGQWAYEAKEAKLIECSPSLKRRFPMVTVDEIYEGIPPKP
jgi:hypothetical protein